MSEQSESAAAEKERLRRERRKERILSGGNDRLRKIQNVHSTGSTSDTARAIEATPELGETPRRVITPVAQTEKDSVRNKSEMPDPPEIDISEFVKTNTGQGRDFLNPPPQLPVNTEPSRSITQIVWEVVHGVYFVLLSVYFSWSLPASSTTREGRVHDEQFQQGVATYRGSIFWYLATVDVVLLSTRFFIERGHPTNSDSVLLQIAAFLPSPFKGILSTIALYSGIYGTLASDVSLLVFALGIKTVFAF